jgi:predicted PurR-regulated permease PerM
LSTRNNPPRTAAPAADETSTAQAATLVRISIALGILATLGVIAALYFARAFFIPLIIGILASYTLHPLVDWLKALRIPQPLAAALVIAILGGALTWTAVSVSDDVAALIEKLPDAARKIRLHVSQDSSGGPTPLQNVQEAARELEKAAATAAGEKKPARSVAVVESQSTWLHDYLLAQSALVATVAAKLPIVLLLVFFLLASGDHFRRKLVQFAGPTLTQKKEVVAILGQTEAQIQRYMLAMLVSNVLIAICTWLAFEAWGLKHAGVWGIAAGVLHFIPYVGPTLIAAASTIAAFLQFGSLFEAVLIGGTSAVIAGVIGVVFMTWLHSRFARVNAAVLFISLLFFGWMWGVFGLLLGAPLAAIAKVVCDHIEFLKPFGELLGR